MPLYGIRDRVVTDNENDSCSVEWSRSIVSARREEKMSAWRKIGNIPSWKLTIRRSPFTYDMSADVQPKRKFMRNVDRRDVRALKNNNAFVISADTTTHILAITSGRLWSWATKALHLAVVSNFPYKAFKSIYFSSVYLGSRAHL